MAPPVDSPLPAKKGKGEKDKKEEKGKKGKDGKDKAAKAEQETGKVRPAPGSGGRPGTGRPGPSPSWPLPPGTDGACRDLHGWRVSLAGWGVGVESSQGLKPAGNSNFPRPVRGATQLQLWSQRSPRPGCPATSGRGLTAVLLCPWQSITRPRTALPGLPPRVRLRAGSLQGSKKKKELPKELRQDPPILRVLGRGMVGLEPLLMGEPLVSTVCNFGVIRTVESDKLTFLRVQQGPGHAPPH